MSTHSCTRNIGHKNTDLASSSHPPDLIALQETKITRPTSSSSDAHMSYSLPPGYPLHSFPRTTPSKKSLHQSLAAVVPSWSKNLLLSLTVLASPLNLLNALP